MQLWTSWDYTAVLGASLIAYIVYQVLYVLFFCPYKNVPGPFLARLTCLWEMYIVYSGNGHRDYVALHRKYGTVVRTGPNRFSFSGPEIRDIYRTGWEKSDYYEGFGDPESPNILSSRKNREHARRKKALIRAYSTNSVYEYDKCIDKQTAVLLQKLAEFADSQTEIELRGWLTLYTFGIITAITVSAHYMLQGFMQTTAYYYQLGKDFKGLEEGSDSTGILRTIENGVVYSAIIGFLPRLHWLLIKVLAFMGSEPPILELLSTAKEAAEYFHQIRQRREPGNPSVPFLENLFSLYDESQTTFATIVDCCVSNIAAGSDTTAITIAATLRFLQSQPAALLKLRQELDNAAVSHESQRLYTFREVMGMPYLEAVVQEALRLHPAVTAILPREVPPGGSFIEGHYFHQGAVVGANILALHLDESSYGQDAPEFRPERWLVETNKPPELMTFSLGSRRCIGEHMGRAMILKAVADIVRRFDINTDSAAPVRVNTAWFSWLDYPCKILPREPNNTTDAGRRAL